MKKLLDKYKNLAPHYKALVLAKVGVATGLIVVHFAPLPPEYMVVVSFLSNIVWLFVF